MDFSALNGHQDMLYPGTPDIARLRADAIPLLTQVNEREALHTQKVVPLPAGMWNALYRLEPAGVVVKLSAGNNDFEVNFLRQAAHLELLVPRVLSAGRLEHPTLAEVTYFVMTWIPDSANAWVLAHGENGVKPMSPEALEQLGRDLGQALAKLHSVQLGYISHFSTRVENWKHAMTDGFSPDWDHIMPNGLFDDTLLPIFEKILNKTAYFAFQDGTLIHCDLNLSNVLVNRDTHQLSAIIDPGSYAGMPMFDLAYAAIPWDHGFAFSDAMVAAYQQSSDRFDPVQYYTSLLVVAYRHSRFHTPQVRDWIFEIVLPALAEHVHF